MRGLPEPLDGAGARRPRSTDNDVTTFVPPIDHNQQGRYEAGWAAAQRAARHRVQSDDLPGPSRRELARLVRQVRTLVILAQVGIPVAGLIGALIGRQM